MIKLKIYDWSKKTRTALRYIKSGDIFMFEVMPGTYAAGRIMTKIDFGHVGELFNILSKEPKIDANMLASATRIGKPIILDSYSFFDRKAEGDWRIVAHQEDYSTPTSEDTFFKYGSDNNLKKVGIFGNEFPISIDEANKYPWFSPVWDIDVKELVTNFFNINYLEDKTTTQHVLGTGGISS